jgi:hypothetical protein
MRIKLMLLIVISAICTTAPASAPASASPKKVTLCVKAWGVRQAVIKKHGKIAPGRNICRLGVQSHFNHKWTRDATTTEKAKYIRTMRALITPPPMMTVSAVPPRQPPAGTLSARATANLPSCTWVPESGGDYNARNGQYIGKYQIGIGHWSTVCRGLGMDPAGQERCAVKVWESEGAGAWANC